MKKNNSRYGEVNDLNLKLVVAIHRSLQKDEKSLSNLLSEYDLTISQFGVLEVLYHKGPLRICDIIEKTLSTSGNMTVVIRNLEKLGYITKERDPEDKRAFIICSTKKGYDVISEVFPRHLIDLEKALSNLDMQEKSNLLALLKKLNGV